MRIFFKKVLHYWKVFAAFLGRVNSVIILTILFVFLFGVYSLVQKIYYFGSSFFKKDTPRRKTYWLDKPQHSPDTETLKRQF